MIPLALAAFLALGLALVVPGAAQAPIAAALGLDWASSGLLASALSVGLGLGVVICGPLVDRWPRRPLFAGTAALGGASLLLARGGLGLPGVTAAMAGLGIGIGAYETVLNTVVPQRDPARATARLALVHAAATLGAALGAPLVGAMVQGLGWERGLHLLGAVFVALALVGARVSFPPPRGTAPGPAPAAPLQLARIAPLATVSFAYVGVETAVSVFLVPFARAAGLPVAAGLAAMSAFWGGLLGARLLLAGARGAPGAGLLVVAGVLGGSSLILAPWIAHAPNASLLVAWSAATGLALGVVFPLNVALIGPRAGARPGTATGIVVGAGSLGGGLIPAATGTIGDSLGPGVALASLALWAGAIVVAAGWARR